MAKVYVLEWNTGKIEVYSSPEEAVKDYNRTNRAKWMNYVAIGGETMSVRQAKTLDSAIWSEEASLLRSAEED